MADTLPTHHLHQSHTPLGFPPWSAKGTGPQLPPLLEARDLARHLQVSLKNEVRSAVDIVPTLAKGDWGVDLWDRGGELIYDSILRVVQEKDEERWILGVEYTLLRDGENAGRLTKFTEVNEGGRIGAVTGPVQVGEMLKLRADSVQPLVVYCRGKKGRWYTGKEKSDAKKDSWEQPEEWWSPEGVPTKEMDLNLQLWHWKSVGAGNDMGLLNSTATDWYRLLMEEKKGCALEAICDKWSISQEDAKQVIQRVWYKGLAPKIQCFLWTVLHRALPTVEGREDWMESMAVAGCTFGCVAWNTLEHVLYECRHAEAIWCALAEWLSVRLGRHYALPARSILIQETERLAEKQLLEKRWWNQLSAWMLHSIWSDWAAATYSSKMKRKPGQIAQTGWYKATRACRAAWMSAKV